MARLLKSVIDSLTEKVSILSLKKEQVEEENRQLRELLAGTRHELDESVRINGQLQQEIDYLVLSHRLADSPEALVESRRIIAALIRKIDRCITLLKDDAEI